LSCSSRFISLLVMNSSSASTCDCCKAHKTAQQEQAAERMQQAPGADSPPQGSAPLYVSAHLHRLNRPCAPCPAALVHRKQTPSSVNGHPTQFMPEVPGIKLTAF
jgi:hypothetical protein